MRIIDWSSDVFSADLLTSGTPGRRTWSTGWCRRVGPARLTCGTWCSTTTTHPPCAPTPRRAPYDWSTSYVITLTARSAERRVRDELRSTCRCRWTQIPTQNNKTSYDSTNDKYQ